MSATQTTPSEIAAAIRERQQAERAIEENRKTRDSSYFAASETLQLTSKENQDAWLAGYDSRDAEVAALREALEAQYAALDPLRLELDALKAHNQQMSEDAIKRPTLRALDVKALADALHEHSPMNMGLCCFLAEQCARELGAPAVAGEVGT